MDKTLENLQSGYSSVKNWPDPNHKPNIRGEALAFAKDIEALAGPNTMVVWLNNSKQMALQQECCSTKEHFYQPQLCGDVTSCHTRGWSSAV